MIMYVLCNLYYTILCLLLTYSMLLEYNRVRIIIYISLLFPFSDQANYYGILLILAERILLTKVMHIYTVFKNNDYMYKYLKR